MKRYFLFFIGLLVTAALMAEDLTLRSGKVFTNFKIVSVSSYDAMVIHDGGVDTIGWDEFPEEIQEKYNYDPKVASEEKAKKSEQNKKFQEEQRTKKEARGILKEIGTSAIEGHLRVSQVLTDGYLASGFGYIEPIREDWVTFSRTEKKGWGLTPNERVSRKYSKKTASRKTVSFHNQIFVVDSTTGLVDKSTIVRWIFPMGTYSYVNVLGAQNTVRKYTSNITDLLTEEQVTTLYSLSDKEILEALLAGYSESN